MTTAANVIERSMRLLGQLAVGTSPNTSEYAIGLIAANAMLGSWNNEKLMSYATREETLTLSPGVASYTIGPSGTLNTVRPVAIDGAHALYLGVTTHVNVIRDTEYSAIPSKTAQATVPTDVYYQASYPLGTLYVFPVPQVASSLLLITRTPFTAFSSTADTVTLPPGWEEALAYNLAVRLGPEFETSASNDVVSIATTSKASIKRVNTRPLILDGQVSAAVGGRKSAFNVVTGQ